MLKQRCNLRMKRDGSSKTQTQCKQQVCVRECECKEIRKIKVSLEERREGSRRMREDKEKITKCRSTDRFPV